ncbi:MAG: WbuC family cupin fold metalloprotein [Candidatus Veblenbacteria bacterium]|nr:WbuC family cupin fold metalloprotein [Candidatus Veblenbacteria bacterium]MDZ4229979.1 WbuC family cupin fold metalloprotein [Candidatus Veblenbacteria bacterium]
MPFTLIDDKLMNEVTAAAQNSARRRSLYTFHSSNDDKVHRLLNVLEPDSYMRPHKHEDPDKVEVFIPLRGKLALIIFANDGRVSEHVVVQAGEMSPWGVEIPPGTWHMTLALEPDTAIYEVVEGPWDPATHKQYPAWAPAEDDRAAGLAFIARLRQELMLY